jgi:hypothetical protein
MNPPAKRTICAPVCPSKGPIFDADSDEFLRQARLGVSSCQGKSVMANAYPVSGNQKQFSNSSVREDSAWDQEADTERVSLVEENARLRALVVQLSNLVLRNVVDQHNTSPFMPVRRLPD